MENTKNGKRGLIVIIAVIAGVLIAAAVVLIILLNGGKKGYGTISVNEIVGDVTIENNGDVYKAYPDMHLTDGFAMMTALQSYSRMSLDDEKFIKLEEESRAKFVAIGTGGKSTDIRLEYGTISNEITRSLREGEEYMVTSPNAVLSVRGTLFIVSTKKDTDGKWITEVFTFGGSVATHRILPDGTPVDETIYVNAGYKTIIKMNDITTYYVQEVDVDPDDNVDPINIDDIDSDILIMVYDAAINGHDVCFKPEEIEKVLEERNVDLSDYNSYHTGKPLKEKKAPVSAPSSSSEPDTEAPVTSSSSESSSSSSDVTSAPEESEETDDTTTTPKETGSSGGNTTKPTEGAPTNETTTTPKTTTVPPTTVAPLSTSSSSSSAPDVTTTAVTTVTPDNTTVTPADTTNGNTTDPDDTTTTTTTEETTPAGSDETSPCEENGHTYKLVKIVEAFKSSGMATTFSAKLQCTVCGDIVYVSESTCDAEPAFSVESTMVEGVTYYYVSFSYLGVTYSGECDDSGNVTDCTHSSYSLRSTQPLTVESSADSDGMVSPDAFYVHLVCDGCGEEQTLTYWSISGDSLVEDQPRPIRTVWADIENDIVTNTYAFSFSYNNQSFSGTAQVNENIYGYYDTLVSECPLCHEEYQSSDVEVERVEPSCSEAGSFTAKCPHCHGVLSNSEIPATGNHTFTSNPSDYEEVWTHIENTHNMRLEVYTTCTECNQRLRYTIRDDLQPDYSTVYGITGAYTNISYRLPDNTLITTSYTCSHGTTTTTTVTPATCSATGTGNATCSLCGAALGQVEIPKDPNNHTYSSDPNNGYVEGTWESTGSGNSMTVTIWAYCLGCSHVETTVSGPIEGVYNSQTGETTYTYVYTSPDGVTQRTFTHTVQG